VLIAAERGTFDLDRLIADGLDMVVGACALVWTIQGDKPLDAWDAWLWIVCFLVIELNVFGFQKAAPSAIGNSPDRA
jgi:hypothetical protein